MRYLTAFLVTTMRTTNALVKRRHPDFTPRTIFALSSLPSQFAAMRQTVLKYGEKSLIMLLL